MGASGLKELADTLVLGALLEDVKGRHGEFSLLAHWKQGEFHHDVVLRLHAPSKDLGGHVIVVSTNCNGGIKEVLLFDEVPQRYALWHARCPDNQDFEGPLPAVLAPAPTTGLTPVSFYGRMREASSAPNTESDSWEAAGSPASS